MWKWTCPPPQRSGLDTPPPKAPREWAGRGRGWASVSLLSSASADTVPKPRGAWAPFASSLFPDVDSHTPSSSGGYHFRKREKENLRCGFGESVMLYPTRLITCLDTCISFFKRPNLLRTLLNEHMKSFQIKEKPGHTFVHCNLWEIILWPGVPSAIMALLASVVSQPPPPRADILLPTSREAEVCAPPPFVLIYLIGRSVVDESTVYSNLKRWR